MIEEGEFAFLFIKLIVKGPEMAHLQEDVSNENGTNISLDTTSTSFQTSAFRLLKLRSEWKK